MTFTHETVDAHTHVISVAGELVGSVGRELIAAAESKVQDDAARVIVDLSDMTFLDSGGLAALLTTWDVLLRARVRLALVIPAGAHVLRTLYTRGVGELFTIAPTRADALRALDAG